MSSLKKEGTKAFFWDFTGRIAKQGMGFIVSIFLARLLEPSDFGLIAMIMVIIGMAQVFSNVGLSGALIQRRRTLPIHYSSVFYFNVFVASLLTILIFFSASSIARFYHNESLEILTQVLSFSFIINALSSVQNAKLRKELKFDILTKARLFSSFISGIVGISFAFGGAGVWSLVALSFTQGILYNILIWSRAGWTPEVHFSFKALFQLWGYGFRMFLSGLLDAIFTRLDYLIIGRLFDASSLGFFQRAKSFNLFVVKYSSGSLMSVLFPILVKVQRDIERFQKIVIKSLYLISFIVFLLLGILYITSYELIILLFGEKWVSSVHFFQILAISGFSYPVSALLVNILSSRGNSKAFLRLEIYKKIVALMNFICLYLYGIDIFLYGLIAQGIIGVYLNIVFASKEISLSKWKFIKPIIIQASISVGVVLFIVYFSQELEYGLFSTFILKGTIFMIGYIVINFIFDTEGYKYFIIETKPLWQKVSRKIKKIK